MTKTETDITMQLLNNKRAIIDGKRAAKVALHLMQYSSRLWIRPVRSWYYLETSDVLHVSGTRPAGVLTYDRAIEVLKNI